MYVMRVSSRYGLPRATPSTHTLLPIEQGRHKHGMNGNSSYQKPEPINGFPKFAYAVTEDPDRTGTIYRRFDRLSSRNLLLMESEIAELEYLQDKYDEEDRVRYTPVTAKSYSDWVTFEKLAKEKTPSGEPLNPQVHERMQLSLLIRQRLEKYRSLERISTPFCRHTHTNGVTAQMKPWPDTNTS